MHNLLPNNVFQTSLRAAAIIAVHFSWFHTANAETIHEQFQRKAPEVISYLNERELTNVGVLKFRVQKPGQKTSDSVGPINWLMADRLEVALILANPFEKERELQIIKTASEQVSDAPSSTHLTADGREQFFTKAFQPAWGTSTLSADAFLTGIAQISDDGLTATVAILCFDKHGSGLERIGEPFIATLDAATATELGESYLLRGAFDDGQTSLHDDAEIANIRERAQQQILTEVTRVKSQSVAFPLSDSSAAVQMQVKYDGRPVAIEFRNGQAFVPEPKQNQKVEFVLTRAPLAKGTLGFVLKVNGENTLYRETTRDVECSKWLLTPDYTQTVISGYQMPDNATAEAFAVLSERESAKRSVDYGRNVGQIQLTVFKELASVEPATIPSDEEEDLLALLRGVQPQTTPQNLDALKSQLRTAGRSRQITRGGLIVAGDETAQAIELHEFLPDPIPVMSVTITYYTP